ncbi:MAG: AmmeMemoRadiSam system radical SAM enzyme [Treponema sp.]|jgi:pyruvate formate lyase activating enzyme|nr:AmmeMemoRadiSam system radical SAM enzyme [Treponema sp.]
MVNADPPEALFFAEEAGSGAAKPALRCTLCPHQCRLAPPEETRAGGTGLCHVRRHGPAGPELPVYGLVSALAADPVEKKPLYHWRPGSRILSAGFTGCNLRCPFCQNWRISQRADVPGRRFSPAALVEEAAGCGQIAYTYSEPLVHAEFVLRCMEAARQGGIANGLVTNGCVRAETAEVLLPLTDAVNVDLKSFSEETYARVLGGDLPAVLNFIRRALELAVHVEITTLVVPGLNDSDEELEAITDFIAGLHKSGPAPVSVPWHLSAYHPCWKWRAPPTDPGMLEAAAERARKKLPHVYTGNTGTPGSTRCSRCGALLVKREGWNVDTRGLHNPEKKDTPGNPSFFCCGNCGAPSPVRRH